MNILYFNDTDFPCSATPRTNMTYLASYGMLFVPSITFRLNHWCNEQFCRVYFFFFMSYCFLISFFISKRNILHQTFYNPACNTSYHSQVSLLWYSPVLIINRGSVYYIFRQFIWSQAAGTDKLHKSKPNWNLNFITDSTQTL